MNDSEQGSEEIRDPSVPSDLLELHVELEKANVTPKKFKEAYGNEVDHKN